MPRKKVHSDSVHDKDYIKDASIQLKYSWERIDDVYFPVIYRNKERYLAARMVELKLLTRFSNVLPQQLSAMKKCVSYYLTDTECVLLDQINLKHCYGEFGLEAFTTQDVVVEFNEFKNFFEMVSETAMPGIVYDLELTKGGWLQVNNTICPFLWLDGIKHVPFELISVAAELDDKTIEEAKQPVTDSQLTILNELCKKAERTFTFTEDTCIVSLVAVKQRWKPVIIELPADKPFDHGQYIDPAYTDENIAELKVAAKEAMNAFYNSAIAIYCNDKNEAEETRNPARKIPNKNSSSIVDVKPLPFFDPEESEKKPSADNSSSKSLEKSQKTVNKLAESVKPIQSLELRSLLYEMGQELSKAEKEMPTLAKTSTNESSSAVLKRRLEAAKSSSNPPAKKQQKDDQSQSVSTRGKKKSLQDRYKITSLNDGFPATIDKSEKFLAIIQKQHPKLLKLCYALPLGYVIDRKALELLSCFIDIYDKASLLLKLAADFIDSQMSSDLSAREAKSVVTDASCTFDFWNAAAHKVSLEAAEVVNSAIVQVCLENHTLSFRRDPDITHYMISGMFGARTVAASANFKFLQGLMTISMMSQGFAVGKSPVIALQMVETHFNDMYPILMKWVQACSNSQFFNPSISHEEFTTYTYKLYDDIYITALPAASGHVHHQPTMLPTIHSLQLFQQSVVPVCQPHISFGLPATLPSHIPTALPTNVLQPAPIPTFTSFPPPRTTVPFVTTNCDPYSMGSKPSSVVSDSGCSWEVVPTIQMVKSVAAPQVCTVPPTQIEQTSEQPDPIILVRKFGKKLPMFKRATDEWLLVEDVQRMYFPRLTIEEFLDKYHTNSLAKFEALSGEVDMAFRKHYQMAPEDRFDTTLMVSSTSLDKLMQSHTSTSAPQ